MEQVKRKDLKIMGSSSAPGGEYANIKIMGDGTVNGNMDCFFVSCMGNANVHGNVSTREMKLRGNLNITGELVAEKTLIQGQADVGRDMYTREANISGMMNVAGDVRSERLNVKGGISVEGNCAAEVMTVTGSSNIKGLLNVGRLEMKMNWSSEIREIGGEYIQVAKGNVINNIISFLPALMKVMPDAKLKADVIEGDRIELEHTEAHIVRGGDIRIGPGCEIGRVEYRGMYDQHPDSSVGEAVRI